MTAFPTWSVKPPRIGHYREYPPPPQGSSRYPPQYVLSRLCNTRYPKRCQNICFKSRNVHVDMARFLHSPILHYASSSKTIAHICNTWEKPSLVLFPAKTNGVLLDSHLQWTIYLIVLLLFNEVNINFFLSSYGLSQNLLIIILCLLCQ